MYSYYLLGPNLHVQLQLQVLLLDKPQIKDSLFKCPMNSVLAEIP